MSFLLSNAAINVQLERAWKYYLGLDENALKQMPLAKAVEVVNALCGFFFLVGVVLTIVFVIYNFPGAPSVSERIKGSGLTRIDEGHVITPLQKVGGWWWRRTGPTDTEVAPSSQAADPCRDCRYNREPRRLPHPLVGHRRQHRVDHK